jgi:hypothetical protein
MDEIIEIKNFKCNCGCTHFLEIKFLTEKSPISLMTGCFQCNLCKTFYKFDNKTNSWIYCYPSEIKHL